MSDWITDRRPMHEDDGTMVYGPDGNICHWTWIKIGDAWKPIPPCDPYVKPKRYSVDALRETPQGVTRYEVWDEMEETSVAVQIPTREAAERIAAIYEEVMP